MTLADLTDAQRADLGRYDLFLRGLFASLARIYRDSDADLWSTFAAANVDPLVAELDPAAVLPNPSDLAGSKDLTAAELATLAAIAKGLRQQFVAHIDVLVRAIGVNV